MRLVITRLLSLSAENVSEEVLWALILVYVILLLVSLTSVWSMARSIGAKVAWTLLLALVPVVGMGFYCLSILVSSDFIFLKRFGFGSRAKVAVRRL